MDKQHSFADEFHPGLQGVTSRDYHWSGSGGTRQQRRRDAESPNLFGRRLQDHNFRADRRRWVRTGHRFWNRGERWSRRPGPQTPGHET
jgi:hypothetical protein